VLITMMFVTMRLQMPMALVAAYDSFEYAPLVSPQLLAVSTDGQLLLIPVCCSGVPPAAGVPPSQVICCLPTPTKWELHRLPDKYQLSPLQQQLPSLFAALSGCKPTAQRSGKKRKAADMDPSKGTDEGAGATAAAKKPTACAGAAEPAAAAGAAAEPLTVNQPTVHCQVMYLRDDRVVVLAKQCCAPSPMHCQHIGCTAFSDHSIWKLYVCI